MITEYKKNRAAGMAARDAIRAARYSVKMAALDWPRYAGDAVTLELPRGERIVIALEHDNDPTGDDFYTIDYCQTARDTHRAGAPDGWIDRAGRVLVDVDDRRSWAWLETDYTLQERRRDASRAGGMARHAAWLAARANLARAADHWRKVQRDGLVGFVVTLFNAAGEEADIEGVWGFDCETAAGQEARGAIARHRAPSRATLGGRNRCSTPARRRHPRPGARPYRRHPPAVRRRSGRVRRVAPVAARLAVRASPGYGRYRRRCSMTARTFYWAWNDHDRQPDPQMTRQRAAVLLRSWRRLMRQPANNRPLISLQRLARGCYRVTHASGESGTIFIAGGAA